MLRGRVWEHSTDAVLAAGRGAGRVFACTPPPPCCGRLAAQPRRENVNICRGNCGRPVCSVIRDVTQPAGRARLIRLRQLGQLAHIALVCRVGQSMRTTSV